MVKIWIESDEWYPCYDVLREPGYFTPELEVEEATAQRWEAAYAEWAKCQNEIAEALEQSGSPST